MKLLFSQGFMTGRRKTLKGILCLAAMPVILHLSKPAFGAGGKTLVVYFSWSGNTRRVAEEIANLTGGTLLELKTVKPYPADYTAVGEVAKREVEVKARPALATKIPANLGSYDTIFIGYPVWNYTMPMPVYTFLDSHKFAGKTILPFSTHLGSGLADGPEQIAKLCPQARVLPGLAINGNSVKQSKPELERWLKQNDISIVKS